MNIPLIGLGTWGMGGKYEEDRSNYKESVEILKAGLNIGFRLIDTAEMYGRGLSEKIVGEAIKDFRREDIFIITKVWKDNLEYNAVIEAAKSSLKRLGVNYIDLYLIHWSTENPLTKEMPLSETMRALEYLVDKKLIRYIGVSNANVKLLKEAENNLNLVKLAANQIEYNLINQEGDNEVIPYCEKNNIKIIAHRPLAKGKLVLQDNEVIKLLVKKYKKTPFQIALNWIMAQNIIPMPKAGNINHLRENYGALGWRMDSKDVELIKRTNFIN